MEKKEKKGVPEVTSSFSYYKKMEEEIIPIECVGHIRPHATYDKDLGYGCGWAIQHMVGVISLTKG